MSNYKETYELYQSVFNEVHAPDNLTQRIKSLDTKRLNKRNNKHILFAAACLAVQQLI